MVRPTRSLLVT